jgi:dihydrofolate reductase
MTGMRISLIAAMAENRVIGRGGALPWDLPADRRRFRELTWGHPVIMGRKTFESIGCSLAGRQNMVLTRQQGYRAGGCLTFGDLPTALEACAGSSEVFIIGGGELYREALPLAQRLYLTIVHVELDGDTLFPEIPAGEFQEMERRQVEDNFPSDFVIYERCARISPSAESSGLL